MLLISIVIIVVVKNVINGPNSYSNNSSCWACYQWY